MITTDAIANATWKLKEGYWRRDILEEKKLLRGKLDRNQKKRMIRTNAMVCRAVWITYMGCEKRIYKKTGGLRNVNMHKNGKKISCPQHNNKLRSARNDWRRKSPDTGRHQQRDKGNGIKKETKKMERTWAVIFSSIFTLFQVTH